MKRILFVILVVVFALSAAAYAQQSSPPQGGPGGPGREMMEKYKNTFELMRLMQNIRRLENDSKYALAPWQAAKVLKVMKPITEKEKLTQEAAADAVKRLKITLTEEQLKKMETFTRQGGPGGGHGQSGPGGGSGQGGHGNGEGGPRLHGENGEGGPPPNREGGDRPKFDPEAMKDFNPFYLGGKEVKKNESGNTSGGSTRMQDRTKIWKDFFKTMEEKAAKAK